MLTGRAQKLSLFVHAIDDGGALCGAMPKGERWVRNESWPITCPRCLMAMSSSRFAVCEIAGARVADPTLHIRKVGGEGLTKRGLPVGTRTLCGQVAGWDIEMVGPEWARYRLLCGHCSRALKVEEDPLAFERSRRARLIRVRPDKTGVSARR